MRSLKFSLLKLYLNLGLFFYFRRIRCHGIGKIPIDKPVLVLCNHQNALLDALIIAVRLPKYGHFLTRASVFKKKKISRFLKSINMMPVFRIRDGWHNLTNNQSIFERCVQLLKQDNIIVLFPEGSHSLLRRVRPLSKGFTRVVYEYLDQDPERKILLVPLGLNYRSITDFVDQATLVVGDPIAVRYDPEIKMHDQVVHIKEKVQNEISALTTNIPKENYEEFLERLHDLNIDFSDPYLANRCMTSDFEQCQPPAKDYLIKIRLVFKVLLKVIMLPPYLIWKILVQPRIVEREFTATFRFAVAVTVVPIYLFLITLLVILFSGFETGILVLGTVISFSLIAVKL
ncbi:MAG: glycerol acyltransferase [Flavobacteriaceae bacterium]|nr:1-acyl-sn-glycerol-3-phosphate acyltransferase [Bacteroidia bacterium]NNK88161.1 glycerol acyltransferase [Flavobacteriaceae bacterium]